MYVTNADVGDENLISFSPRVQEYLITAGVPIYTHMDNCAFFRKSSFLRGIIRESPAWVRNLIEEGGYEFE